MEFTQCSYLGQHSADGRRFDGLGRYTFANGDVYLGGMKDGQFHGHGVVFFRSPPGGNDGSSGGSPMCTNPASPRPLPPTRGSRGSSDDVEDDALQGFLSPGLSSTMPAARAGESPMAMQDFAALVGSGGGGGGQYRGVWEHGRHMEGHYVFQDGLVYGSSGTADMSAYAQKKRRTLWTYCHGSDRRLWEEYLQNVAPVLPHEALLGGARLLHARKQAMREEGESHSEGPTESSDTTGEGLPMVLPRAFVHARTAPAFAKGQLTSVGDPRVARWVEAAAAAEEREAASRRELQQQQTASSPARSSRRPTDVRSDRGVGADSEASTELVESTIALQFAMAIPTEGLRADGRLDDAEVDEGDARDEVAEEDEATVAALVAAPIAPQPALNLTVCRVLDVEDVNRALVQIAAAP
ncbi:hypothetical protein LPMP_221150 [Leishmania panamensis]|uniref:MORN repeat-containing protein 5 n=1 Tax=Leishmania panamensis TaxID=5679 RepID=A0A088RR03_LEIPA|nr:hypothetical protein LPMP_221150 [Leishmania panamensis]AIN98408.1 hypothetical protein LPMP_221150 [Leishmania panamensis]